MINLFTKEEDALLREYLAAGLSFRKTGELLGRTRNSIIGRCHRLTAAGSAPVRVKGPRQPRKKKCLPPTPPAQEPIAEQYGPFKQIELFDLKPGMCKWPMNTPSPKESYVFCGKVGGKPYCTEHAEQATNRRKT